MDTHKLSQLISWLFMLLSSFLSVFASTISTVAGGGPDGLTAVQANLDSPAGVAAGNFGIYYVSAGNRVFAIDTHSNSPTISVLAGNGRQGDAGDGGPARSASLNKPAGLALDGAFLFVADAGNHSVKKIDLRTGNIFRVAGNGASGSGADSGPALSASFEMPISVAVDLNHQVYFGDAGLNRVYRVAVNGAVSRIAGTGVVSSPQGIGDGGPAVNALLSVRGMAIYRNLMYVSDPSNFRIRVVDFATSRINTFAGRDHGISCGAQNGPPTDICLGALAGLTVNGSGDVFAGDSTSHGVWVVQRLPNFGLFMKTIAGNGAGDNDGDALTTARMDNPVALSASATGTVLIADQPNNKMKLLNESFRSVTTIAGNRDPDFSGDSGSATGMSLKEPLALAILGNSLYVGDNATRRVYELALGQGTLSRIAGDGNPNNDTPDSIPGAWGLAVDSAQNLYLADGFTKVRRKSLGAGPFGQFAGTNGIGTDPLEGPAGFVPLFQPQGVSVKGDRDVLIADSSNNRIRIVAYADGYETVVAGDGSTTPRNDVLAVTSGFNGPRAAITAPDGRIFIADTLNNMIRVIGIDGIVRKFAGTGTFGYAGNGQPAQFAFLRHPSALLLDGNGGLLVADTENHQIRRIDLTTTIIDVFAGVGGALGEGYTGDGGDPKNARLSYPSALARDSQGTVYIADVGNGRIRAVAP